MLFSPIESSAEFIVFILFCDNPITICAKIISSLLYDLSDYPSL